jgi:MYXO-CTERM domain-containing protein
MPLAEAVAKSEHALMIRSTTALSFGLLLAPVLLTQCSKEVTSNADVPIVSLLQAHASVRLPKTANGAFTVATEENAARRLSVAVRVVGASNALGEKKTDGSIHYQGALGEGSELVQVVTPEGTEDTLRLDAPSRNQLAYEVTLSPDVAGLRLVSNSLEFLDAEGAPRLRVKAPYGVDANGRRFAVTLSVEDCAVDTDPRAPWGRPVIAAGARTCVVHTRWNSDGLAFPIGVDPAWAATNTMDQSNISYEMLMTKLSGGKVLVANQGGSTQLFDPTTNTWATTGSPATIVAHRSRLIATDGDSALAITVLNAPPVLAKYSLATGLWTDGTLPAGINENGAAAVNLGGTKVLILDANGPAFVYDLATDTSIAKAAASSVGPNAAAINLGGGKIAFTGYNTRNVQVYDVATNAWSTSAAALVGDTNCAHLEPLSDGKILNYSQDGLAAVLDLTLGTSTTVTPPAGFALSYICARTANAPYGTKKHYLGGGRFSFDEVTGLITDDGAFPSGAGFHGAIVRLDDGRYLAAGGNVAAPNASADIYGPSSSADCVSPTPLFFPSLNVCGACASDYISTSPFKCPTVAAPACQKGAANPLVGTCTECSATNESGCSGTAPRCNLTTGACAKCDGGFGSTSARACKAPSTPACLSTGACAAANGDFGTTATQPCPTAANPFSKADGSCGKCSSNAECALGTHAGAVCNTTTGACGATCSGDADCGPSTYCDLAGGKTCSPRKADGASCVRKEECAKLSCANGTCGEPAVMDAGVKPGADASAPSTKPDAGVGATNDGAVSGSGCSCRVNNSRNSTGSTAFGLALFATALLRARRKTN